MNFSKKIFFIILISAMSVNVFADNHNDNSELVEKAKKITEEIASKNQIDEDEVPLNDPFAGNEGMSSSTVNPETGEERDEMSLYNFKLSGLISGKDESYITLTNTSGDVITLNLNQYLGKIKFVDLRLTEAIFEKDDKTFIIIDFNNQIRESDEY